MSHVVWSEQLGKHITVYDSWDFNGPTGTMSLLTKSKQTSDAYTQKRSPYAGPDAFAHGDLPSQKEARRTAGVRGSFHNATSQPQLQREKARTA